MTFRGRCLLSALLDIGGFTDNEAMSACRLKPLLQQMTNDMDILRLGPNATNSDQIDLTDDTVYRAF